MRSICNYYCDMLYENQSYRAKQKNLLHVVKWADIRIFYLSFEPLNVYVGYTTTKIQPFKAGQSLMLLLTLLTPLTLCNFTVAFGKATKLPKSVLEPL